MPEILYEKIIENYPREKDRELIRAAFEFALESHRGQKRFSGEDYIFHPLRAAAILSNLKVDAQTIAACLLHDVVDDTSVTPQQLEEKFGPEIAFLVKGVSSLGKLRLPKQDLEIASLERKGKKPPGVEIENLRRMFFAMAEDIRVILIKLADRIHNMETLEFIPVGKQKRMALETMEIFAPLAGRLGINTFRTKLENLAFPFLYPKEYQWMKEHAQERREQEKGLVNRQSEELKKILGQEGIGFLEIKARSKSDFSLYRKLLEHQMDLDRIYDLSALRLIVPDVKTCYEALGAIHKYWRPMPGRIKDYIAFPKPNGYQSLHTTVFCQEAKILEVQIRTPEMNETAEYGICAHWAKKEGLDLKRQAPRYGWIQQLANWQRENKNAQEFLEGLKIDFFKDRIFVFTPKGDIIDLPEGATPIDFAYAVHSDIGSHAVGAKTNGKMIALSEPLPNGAAVEILTDKNKRPSRDWLKFVKTNLAKSHIRKQTEREIAFISGLRALKERFFRPPSAPPLEKPVEEKLSPENAQAAPTVLIGGKTNVAHVLAKCCQPQPGQKISAYVARVKGKAVIHLQTCQNLERLKSRHPEKVLGARWQ